LYSPRVPIQIRAKVPDEENLHALKPTRPFEPQFIPAKKLPLSD
jgi:hypothetical protein